MLSRLATHAWRLARPRLPASRRGMRAAFSTGANAHDEEAAAGNAEGGESAEPEPAAAADDTADVGADDGATAGSDAPAEDDAAADDVARELADLKEKQEEMEAKYLSGLAEMENTRRIAKNDVENARKFAVKGFAKDILEVADNLSRGLDSVAEADREDNVFYDGVQKTDAGLQKVLGKHGITKIDVAPGMPLDPLVMDALFEIATENAPTGVDPGAVGMVSLDGYLLNGRVLRPASVGVVSKKS